MNPRTLPQVASPRGRAWSRDRDRGFTLIELLVVVIIVGVLAAVAIPVYLNQRKKAFDASVKGDVRNAIHAAEVFAVDNPGSTADISPTDLWVSGFRGSKGGWVAIHGSPAAGYCVSAFHPGATVHRSLATTMKYDSTGDACASAVFVMLDYRTP